MCPTRLNYRDTGNWTFPRRVGLNVLNFYIFRHTHMFIRGIEFILNGFVLSMNVKIKWQSVLLKINLQKIETMQRTLEIIYHTG